MGITAFHYDAAGKGDGVTLMEKNVVATVDQTASNSMKTQWHPCRKTDVQYPTGNDGSCP